jgi:glycolate oxidase iron-sulfur subunit
MSPSGSHLKNLDYSVVQQCMHCGLCLPTCPTYDATKLNATARAAGSLSCAPLPTSGSKPPGPSPTRWLRLGCLACMTACPAGVNYAELFEHARAEAEQSGALESRNEVPSAASLFAGSSWI